MILSGDAHCIAADDGTHSNFATGGSAPLAEILAAPLDNNGTSVKGDPWSQGTFKAPDGSNAYGLVTVTFSESSTTV